MTNPDIETFIVRFSEYWEENTATAPTPTQPGTTVQAYRIEEAEGGKKKVVFAETNNASLSEALQNNPRGGGGYES